MGRVFKHDLYYAPAAQMRTLHVYLPTGYDEHPQERYPVMYFFDGHNLFADADATYGKSWGLARFLDGWEKPLVVVGMECSHEGDARLDEYCPYHARMFGHELAGLGEETFQWIVREVKPWADANLRTWAHREATGIGGSSMGGLMSVYGVTVHNDVFSKAACVSPGLRTWGSRLARDLRASHVEADTRVYLSWGEHEAGRTRAGADPASESPEARAELKFEALLQERGVRTYRYFQPGGRHCEADWELQNGRYLDFLWRDRCW